MKRDLVDSMKINEFYVDSLLFDYGSKEAMSLMSVSYVLRNNFLDRLFNRHNKVLLNLEFIYDLRYPNLPHQLSKRSLGVYFSIKDRNSHRQILQFTLTKFRFLSFSQFRYLATSEVVYSVCFEADMLLLI